MKQNDEFRRARCAKCGWQSIWGLSELQQRLRQLGMLRRENQPSAETVLQLAAVTIHRIHCPECDLASLELEEYIDDFDGLLVSRACEICSRPIPIERLQLFPEVMRCARCQDLPEEAIAEDDFCPRCGAMLRVRIRAGAGVARYQSACSDCGYRR